MHSAIYRGSLRHRRFAPRAHAFTYPLFLVYLDLAELDAVFGGRWLWSTQRTALARFDRKDHFGDPQVPLDTAVRDLVDSRTGRRPTGPIRLLTHLRYFGYCFNPVSFYYCFDPSGEDVEVVVAEVTNTPWGETHCYVLHQPAMDIPQRYRRYTSRKSHHVSPFMPMDLSYDWGFGPPGEQLNVHMMLHDPVIPLGGKIFDATLSLKRAPITGPALASALLRFPLMTLQVILSIHWQALKLWLKGVPVHTHPDKSAQATSAPSTPSRSPVPETPRK
jgi:uncharacterized protein